MSQLDKNYFGPEVLDALVERLRQERPAIIVTCAAKSILVSDAGKSLSRAMRAQDSLVEFYEPSGVDALLESTSRLLTDLDVSALGGDYGAQPRSRILMIDAAEDLSNDEVDSLLRLLSGLKGVPLYAILLAHTPDGLAGEPTLRRLQQKAFFWQVDAEAPKVASEKNSIEPEAKAPSDNKYEFAPVAPYEDDYDEENEEPKSSSRHLIVALLMLLLLVLIGGGWWLWQTHGAAVSQWVDKATAPPPPKAAPALADDGAKKQQAQIAAGSGQGNYVLSCGQYHDPDLLEVVESRVKILSPTRRVEHDGITELFAGGYASIDEAQKALTVLLPIGPCRTEIRTFESPDASASPKNDTNLPVTDQRNGQVKDQGGKTHE